MSVFCLLMMEFHRGGYYSSGKYIEPSFWSSLRTEVLMWIFSWSTNLSSKVSMSFTRFCKHNCFNPLPLPHSFVSIKIKNIGTAKIIETVWYQYGSHQYSCNKPWTLQGNFWCVMASLRLSGLDAAKSMGLDAVKSWLGILRKLSNQKHKCFIGQWLLNYLKCRVTKPLTGLFNQQKLMFLKIHWFKNGFEVASTGRVLK